MDVLTKIKKIYQSLIVILYGLFTRRQIIIKSISMTEGRPFSSVTFESSLKTTAFHQKQIHMRLIDNNNSVKSGVNQALVVAESVLVEYSLPKTAVKLDVFNSTERLLMERDW